LFITTKIYNWYWFCGFQFFNEQWKNIASHLSLKQWTPAVRYGWFFELLSQRCMTRILKDEIHFLLPIDLRVRGWSRIEIWICLQLFEWEPFYVGATVSTVGSNGLGTTIGWRGGLIRKQSTFDWTLLKIKISFERSFELAGHCCHLWYNSKLKKKINQFKF